jgi:outer membrane protein OmpA-like peptidoglycan-associated protein
VIALNQNLISGIIICIALGLIDLYYLNFQIVPALWPEPTFRTAAQPAVLLNGRIKPVLLKQPHKKTIQSSAAKLISKIVFRFEPERFSLKMVHRHQLKKALKQIRDLDQIWFQIDGHADRTGGHLFDNDLLSRQRADAVASFLKSQSITSCHIKINWSGSSRPVDNNNTPTAWARNRRAVVRIKKGKP